MKALRSTDSITDWVRREKRSRFWVMRLQRWTWMSIWLIESSNCSLSSGSAIGACLAASSSSWRSVRMMASGLLISWATPADSSPIEASFPAWSNCWFNWSASASRRLMVVIMCRVMKTVTTRMLAALRCSSTRVQVLAWLTSAKASAWSCCTTSSQRGVFSQALHAIWAGRSCPCAFFTPSRMRTRMPSW